MAGIGLSKPYFAIYAENGGMVSYSGGRFAGKAVALDLSLESGSDNVLYGDNGPAETDTQFAGGTITLTTTDLSAEVLAALLGVQVQELAIAGLETSDATELVYGDAQSAPYVGFGAISKRMVDNEIKWVGIVYTKVKFGNISDSLETQGETISWQTPEIVGTLMRDDSSDHIWKRVSSYLDSEADALLYIQSILGTGDESE